MHQDLYFQRPFTNLNIKESSVESEPDESNNYATRQKPTFFNVMLNFYPQTDIDLSETTSKLRPQKVSHSYTSRNPAENKHQHRETHLMSHENAAIPLASLMMSQQIQNVEKNTNHMIFHINFFPRKKNKFSR